MFIAHIYIKNKNVKTTCFSFNSCDLIMSVIGGQKCKCNIPRGAAGLDGLWTCRSQGAARFLTNSSPAGLKNTPKFAAFGC